MQNVSSVPAGRSASFTKDAHRRSNRPTQEYVFVNHQAATLNGTKSQNSRISASTGVKCAGATRSHPTMRFSHVQRNSSTSPNMASIATDKDSSEKSKYHEAISRNTQDRFDQELSKAFGYPILPSQMSRDAPIKYQPRLSLAATHPSNYGSQTKQNNVPTPPESVTVIRRTSSSSAQSQFSPMPQSGQAPIDPPYTDPMYQTSTVANYWSRSRTVLKADTNIEYSNVISPTFMIGLPMGSMVEVANQYDEVDSEIS